MRVLMITRKFPPSTGGMELFAHDLSQALSNEVDLTLVKWGGSNRGLVFALPYLWLQAFYSLLTRKTDVLHLQDALLAPFFICLAWFFRKPLVVIVHGLDVTYGNRLYQMVVPRALRRAQRIICISGAAADEVKKRGIAVDNVQVIPLAVQDVLYGKSNRDILIKRLGLAHDAKTLLTVGRLVKRKGVAWFIENVLPELVKKYPSLVYIVVGEGEERHNIEAATLRARLSDHVRLLGKVKDDLYEAAYNGTDLFLMPNVNVPGDIEGFGLVLLEASLCARPIVAAAIEGIKDAVSDGQNATLVPSGNAEAFAQAIKKFLDEPTYAKQFGDQSRKYTLANYRWPAIATRYVEIYRHITRS